MKISEWLNDLDGHSACDAEILAADFRARVGAAWPAYLKGTPVKILLRQGKRDPKGLAFWTGRKDARVLAGYEVARALAATYVAFQSKCLGRGSEFRDCLDALRKGGM